MHDLFFSPLGIVSSTPPAWVLPLLPFIVIGALWAIVIKGYALWHAARNEQKWWFIALLVVNTLSILEIIYLIWYRPHTPEGEKTPDSQPAPVVSSIPEA